MAVSPNGKPHGFGGKPWPYRPRPLPDETLSSYLIRAASEMNMRPITLLYLCWGTDRSFLNQDLDNYAPDCVVDVIVHHTMRAPEAIREMTLAALEGSLTATFNARGRQSWTLPTTVSNNDRRRHGVQFCPACLRTDAVPYFRRTWRLAFATICTVHGIPLLDACPECGAVLRQHAAASIVHCAECACDLRWTGGLAMRDQILTSFQSRLESTLTRGWDVLNGRQIRAHHMFAIVRQVATLLVNGRRAMVMRSAIARELGGDPTPYDKPTARQPIEYLRVDERRRLFGLVARLIEAWPTNFVSICYAVGMQRSHAIKDMTDPPFDYETVMRDWLDATPYCATEPEVAAAAAWLRRTKGRATYTDLKALCGESRAAIYLHMDYQRKTSRPSYWRSRALASAAADSVSSIARTIKSA